jgi:rSAM/selenodomain-associated transferase 2
MDISVVVPTYNEGAAIARLIRYLRENSSPPLLREVVVADGMSTDNTVALARRWGARTVIAERGGRAAGMNAGAEAATGDILYFLHADTYPPPGFASDIVGAVERGFGAGCFKLRFDADHWLLRLDCWFLQFGLDAFRFGDQSLFVCRGVFERIGGFRPDILVLEDTEIVRRIRRHARFVVLDRNITTSARKFRANGVYRLNLIFALLILLYHLGCPQAMLARSYRKLIR